MVFKKNAKYTNIYFYIFIVLQIANLAYNVYFLSTMDKAIDEYVKESFKDSESTLTRKEIEDSKAQTRKLLLLSISLNSLVYLLFTIYMTFKINAYRRFLSRTTKTFE